jgi:Cu(I)/Ag(I) efflux system protein CusF
MKRTFTFIAAAALSAVAFAQASHKATGTVSSVDRDRGKVTIKHGPVPSLNWPGMNMAFGVKDKALLDKVKPGQKIEFSFVEQGRDYVVTEVK